MGIRGELFSFKFVSNERTYFFNVKENRTGDVFLTIVESKENELNTYERHSVVVFEENIDEFMKALNDAVQGIKSIKKHKPVIRKKSDFEHNAVHLKKPVVRVKKSKDSS